MMLFKEDHSIESTTNISAENEKLLENYQHQQNNSPIFPKEGVSKTSIRSSRNIMNHSPQKTSQFTFSRERGISAVENIISES